MFPRGARQADHYCFVFFWGGLFILRQIAIALFHMFLKNGTNPNWLASFLGRLMRSKANHLGIAMKNPIREV